MSEGRGWFVGAAGTRHVAIPLGQRRRLARCLVTCTTDEQADERARVVREMARLVIASGNAHELARWVKSAVEGDDAKALAVLGYAQQLAAGKVATKATAPSKTSKTFSEVAKLWTSGELTRLYPDHVAAKRTASLDVSRLDLLGKAVGDVPIERFTVEDAERAMRSLPAGLRPATRRQYAQVLRRVLELAAYPLRLIPANPLPRLWLPKPKHDLALQVLFPDEEARLLVSPKVPLAYRMAYGFLARMGFRKSEAIGDTETGAEPLRWRDFDLERGLVRVARSKTEKPRPVPLDAGVCAALAAYKEHVHGVEASPVFRGVRLSHAETFREHLLAAGVDRAELHASTKDSLPIRIHDLRATFVTVSLATGKSDSWIRDRTAHRSVAMVDKYRRAARTFEELHAGDFCPMLNALAGLSVNGASTDKELAEAKQELTMQDDSQFQRVDSNHDKRNQKALPPTSVEADGPLSSRKTGVNTQLREGDHSPIDAPVDALGVSYTTILEGLRAVVRTAIAQELERRRGTAEATTLDGPTMRPDEPVEVRATVEPFDPDANVRSQWALLLAPRDTEKMEAGETNRIGRLRSDLADHIRAGGRPPKVAPPSTLEMLAMMERRTPRR